MTATSINRSVYANCLSVLLASFTILLPPGCGTWIGNPEDEKKPDTTTNANVTLVTMQFQGTDPLLNLATATSVTVKGNSTEGNGTLSLTEAYVVLDEIVLKKKEGVAKNSFKGPFILDLISNSVTPELQSIELESGAYNDVKIKIAKLDTEKFKGKTPNPGVEKNSIFLSGTFTSSGGQVRPFKMVLPLDEEFSLSTSRSKETATEVTGVTSQVIMAFRLSKWFDFTNSKLNEKKLDFSSITGTTIDISENSAETPKKLGETIKEMVKYSARFGKDKDGNGKLDKTEDDDN